MRRTWDGEEKRNSEIFVDLGEELLFPVHAGVEGLKDHLLLVD